MAIVDLFTGTGGFALKSSIGEIQHLDALSASGCKDTSLSSIKTSISRIETSLNNVPSAFAGFCSGYELDSNLLQLRDVYEQNTQFYATIQSLYNKVSDNGYEQAVDKYIGNSRYAISFTQQTDKTLKEYKDILERIMEINAVTGLTISKVEGTMRHATLCDRMLKEKEGKIEERAMDTYRDNEIYGVLDEFVKRVQERPVAASIVPHAELYYTNHAAFAHAIANDKEVTDKDLSAFLYREIIQHIDSGGKEYAWLLRKWKDRTDNIDKLIDMCIRLCRQKISSWSKTINIIFAWIKERQFDTGHGAKAKFIFYMQSKYPDVAIDSEDVRHNCSVTEAEKKEYFPDFDAYSRAWLAC